MLRFNAVGVHRHKSDMNVGSLNDKKCRTVHPRESDISSPSPFTL
jgi:hypothetical protein